MPARRRRRGRRRRPRRRAHRPRRARRRAGRRGPARCGLRRARGQGRRRAARAGAGLSGAGAARPAALVGLYGDDAVLDEARARCPSAPAIAARARDLRRLAATRAQAHPRARIGFDLADSSGYAYYSGARFAAYARGASDAIARGGRYDEVGAIFGRNRPAVGFGLDVKDLAMLSLAPAPRAPIARPGRRRRRAARCDARAARARRDRRRRCPAHEREADEFAAAAASWSAAGRDAALSSFAAALDRRSGPAHERDHRATAPAPGRNVVVVGTQWGDEGKGKVVDWLTDHAAGGGPLPGRPQRRPHARHRRRQDGAAADPVGDHARRRSPATSATASSSIRSTCSARSAGSRRSGSRCARAC